MKLSGDYCYSGLFVSFPDVHSALQHDKIMLSSNPDSLLVENEASRVAKDAAEALKRAREASRQQAIGIPTWTGHHGGQKQR